MCRLYLLLILLLCACGGEAVSTATPAPTVPPATGVPAIGVTVEPATATSAPSATATETAAPSETVTAQPTFTPASTSTRTPLPTLTPKPLLPVVTQVTHCDYPAFIEYARTVYSNTAELFSLGEKLQADVDVKTEMQAVIDKMRALHAPFMPETIDPPLARILDAFQGAVDAPLGDSYTVSGYLQKASIAIGGPWNRATNAAARICEDQEMRAKATAMAGDDSAPGKRP